ncbi:delta(24)-sterol reductase [Eurytemora carolleeae]|uniref:delta(24)-sterol reductase n=1 Tax=Eurytemora carolleeae TaxID=1294199 RepID=UPI000C76F14E|nr:delta(24)-sterol reductase [Eurytemora carolleeae]|eukprot:XP_023349654.1 delta(24)-sterol reductase-like [Eurytemora affinis]
MGLDWAKYVCPILLPISFLYDSILYWLTLARYYTRHLHGTHEERVLKVQEQVRRWQVEGRGRKMCTARPSWMSISQQKLGYKDTMYRVKIDLGDVLEIDKEKMIVRVEPAVTIGFLNRLLVANGYTLPVVPELDILTIGGLVMGGGLESTSHKYGLFQYICSEFEIVAADGEVMIANHDTNSDLYYALPVSYGTLGFLTSVSIRIIPYKPYMKLTYRPAYSIDETISLLDRETHKATSNDSVEGIVYNVNQSVIMTGQYVEEEEVEKDKINRMGLWFKPWFYKYVEKFLEKGETIEYVPTLHFHQRHNKGTFWLTPMWLPWAHNIIARFLFGWILPVNPQLLNWLKETFVGGEFEDNFNLQDFIIPMKHVKEGILLSAEITDVWPLWMVPTRLYQPQGPKSLMPRGGDTMYVDLGVYGLSHLKTFKGRDATLRLFEKFALEHDGFQALYAETLMTNEEFETMYTGDLYYSVRKRIPNCEKAFPRLFDKISREGRQGKKIL